MPCTGRYATATDFGDFWCLDTLSPAEITTIEHFLDLAAADMHVALAASGACSCTWQSWATNYMKKLNVIDAAVIYNCPCGTARLTDAMKQTWLRWIDEQLTAIRDGRLELCEGETGADFPALGWAERSWTDENAARIIVNTEARNP